MKRLRWIIGIGLGLAAFIFIGHALFKQVTTPPWEKSRNFYWSQRTLLLELSGKLERSEDIGPVLNKLSSLGARKVYVKSDEILLDVPGGDLIYSTRSISGSDQPIEVQMKSKPREILFHESVGDGWYVREMK